MIQVEQDYRDNSVVKVKKEEVEGAAAARPQVLVGMPDALQGVKINFLGTLNNMDRATSIATAERFGSTLTDKLREAD